jgi:hypothetical protein
METGIFIKYAIILASILGLAYLSQQAFFNKNSKTFIYGVTSQASSYLASASNWATSKIYPKMNGVVQNGGDVIKNTAEQQKNKVSENISEKVSERVSNYFSGITNSVIHPGTPQNCPAQTSTNP